MPKIHNEISMILNDFTQNFYPGEFPEIIDCLLLDIKSCVDDDLNKTYPLDYSGEILKMNDIEQVKDYAINLRDENKELKKGLQITEFFATHSRHFAPKNYNKLREVATRFVEKGTLDIEDSMWIMKNNESTPESRVELENLEIEARNKLLRLGGIKKKIR